MITMLDENAQAGFARMVAERLPHPGDRQALRTVNRACRRAVNDLVTALNIEFHVSAFSVRCSCLVHTAKLVRGRH